MRIGLALPQYGRFADPGLTVRVAEAAEAIGYDSLWAGDRLLVPVEPQSRYPGGDGTIPAEFRGCLDPLTLLTAAAVVTRRVRLGQSTLNALWQPPALLARTLATLDALSGGRLDIGLGLGWSKDEYEAVGVPWPGRGARLEETLDVLDDLWAEDGVTVRHKGELWQVPESWMDVRPAQRPRPPVLLGGFTPAALDRVGRRADGWLAGGLPLPALAAMWQSVRTRADQAGRDPGALRLVVRANAVVTAEPAPPAQVPHRGTVDQLAGYLADAAAELGAEALIDLHFAARDGDEYLALAEQLHAALRSRTD